MVTMLSEKQEKAREDAVHWARGREGRAKQEALEVLGWSFRLTKV